MTEIPPSSKTEKGASLPRPASKKTPAKKKEAPPLEDKITLSKTAPAKESRKTSAQDIRHDLVQKYKAHLKDGTYVVKADEIADKMVQKIRENKNRFVF